MLIKQQIQNALLWPIKFAVLMTLAHEAILANLVFTPWPAYAIQVP
jgi:hypothetical protein